MDIDNLKRIICSGDFTEQNISLAQKIFIDDANANCSLLDVFCNFMEEFIRRNQFITDERVHLCSYAYIVSIENRHPEKSKYLAILYNREAEYYTIQGISNESMFYAQKTLDMKDIPHVLYVNALIYIFNMLANAGLYSLLLNYIDRIRALLEDDEIDIPYKRVLLISLMDCYALNHKYQEYSNVCIALLDERRKMTDKDILKESMDIHYICSEFVFEETVSKKSDEEIRNDFYHVIALLRSTHDVIDNFEPIFNPVFEKVRQVMPRQEFIERVLEIITLCMANTDKIAFFEYLIKICGVDENEYPQVKEEYLSILREYYTLRAKAEKQFVEISIIEYSLQKKYKDEANTDKLTGLLSRNAYYAHLAGINLTNNTTVVVVDINRMKYINDTYGHDAGDKALICAADRLKRCFSHLGNIYRYGGDEFYIIAECSEQEVKDAVDKVYAMHTEEIFPGMKLDMSVGYARYASFPDQSIDHLIKAADNCMYAEKNNYYNSTGYKRRV